MISDPKNLSEQLCNLSERLGIEMRTLNRTKVSTVNGLIPDNSGAITVDVGVTSFNGSKGAVTYTAPVTSVNGKMGAVTVDVGVKTVNGTQPDSDGNVTIQTGGDTSNLVPKTGNRGVLAGYQTYTLPFEEQENGITVTPNSPDELYSAYSSVTVADFDESWWLAEEGEDYLKVRSFMKIVYVSAFSSITLGEGWVWQGNEVPSIGVGFLILYFPPSPEPGGIAFYVEHLK